MALGILTHDLYPSSTGVGEVPGGCAFYRCQLPTMGLPGVRMGRPAFDPNRGFGIRLDEEHAVFGYRTVVLKLLMEAWIPRAIRQAQAIGQRVIVDVDDHYDDIPDGNVAKDGSAPENDRTHNRAHYRESILAADTVTVSTPFLADHYSKLHPDVRMVRNSVLPDMFTFRRPTNKPKPVIGWVGSVPWKGGDLEQLRSWLPDFLEEHDLAFHHSGHIDGHPTFADVVGIDPARVTTLPLVPLDVYGGLFAPIDIGIVPLAANDFNEAKSNLKGLEYACSGIPFVAAPTGEYRRLAHDGVGTVAHTPAQWVESLTRLLDYKVRRREAAEAVNKVRRFWSITARQWEWIDVFEDVSQSV